jgi:hypothetical protein
VIGHCSRLRAQELRRQASGRRRPWTSSTSVATISRWTSSWSGPCRRCRRRGESGGDRGNVTPRTAQLRAAAGSRFTAGWSSMTGPPPSSSTRAYAVPLRCFGRWREDALLGSGSVNNEHVALVIVAGVTLAMYPRPLSRRWTMAGAHHERGPEADPRIRARPLRRTRGAAPPLLPTSSCQIDVYPTADGLNQAHETNPGLHIVQTMVSCCAKRNHGYYLCMRATKLDWDLLFAQRAHRRLLHNRGCRWLIDSAAAQAHRAGRVVRKCRASTGVHLPVGEHEDLIIAWLGRKGRRDPANRAGSPCCRMRPAYIHLTLPHHGDVADLDSSRRRAPPCGRVTDDRAVRRRANHKPAAD